MAQVVSDLASSPLDVSHLLCFIQSALCSSLSIAFQGFMLAWLSRTISRLWFLYARNVWERTFRISVSNKFWRFKQFRFKSTTSSAACPLLSARSKKISMEILAEPRPVLEREFVGPTKTSVRFTVFLVLTQLKQGFDMNRMEIKNK